MILGTRNVVQEDSFRRLTYAIAGCRFFNDVLGFAPVAKDEKE